MTEQGKKNSCRDCLFYSHDNYYGGACYHPIFYTKEERIDHATGETYMDVTSDHKKITEVRQDRKFCLHFEPIPLSILELAFKLVGKLDHKLSSKASLFWILTLILFAFTLYWFIK